MRIPCAPRNLAATAVCARSPPASMRADVVLDDVSFLLREPLPSAARACPHPVELRQRYAELFIQALAIRDAEPLRGPATGVGGANWRWASARGVMS